jgi:tetratricopeptide (TPR) repeat protein
VIAGLSPAAERQAAQLNLSGCLPCWPAVTADRLYARTGQETLTLTGDVKSVAFSPDGNRIVSLGADNTLKVWDAEEQSAVDHIALKLVQSLFRKALLRTEVVEQLRRDKGLSDAVRQKALYLAERCTTNLSALNSASWSMLCQSDPEAASYARALLLAEEACRLAPNNRVYLNTLGVAHHRVGNYPAALETLSKSERVNMARFHGSNPAALAFLAMTYHRLGQKEKELEILGRLRETVKKHQWAGDEEVQGFLREAEALEQGQNDPFVGPSVGFAQFPLTSPMAAFSPDGKRIVSAGMDGKIRVWDTQTGKETLTLEDGTS